MNTVTQYIKGKKLIGKGAFTKCYDNGDNTVTLISSCPWKELLALGWTPESSRLPECKRIDCDWDVSVYTMPKLEKVTAPKKQLRPKEYELYKKLRKLAEDFYSSSINRKAYDRLDIFRDCVKDSDLHHTQKQLLTECAESMANYTTQVGFECSPRNIAVKNGKLILLDLFFSVEHLNKVRSK